MTGGPGRAAVGPLLRHLRRLRFPWLFAVTLLLFAVDLLVPDVIPFADEILLGLLATLLGAIRSRRRDGRGAADRDGRPEGGGDSLP